MAMSAAAAYAATRKPQREQQQGQQGQQEQQENQETQEQQKLVGEQPELQQLPPPLQTIAVNSMGGPVSNGQDGQSGGSGGSDDDMTKNANGGTRPAANTAAYTPTALSRWSVAKRKLPAVDTIRSLHVYDFDNTLFKTPLPNAKLWNAATMGYLASQDVLATGGWWHDARILAATGRGLAEEEPRAWAGWWNEHIVELVQLTASQPDALSVLLTGRAERAFADLIQRMAASRGLVFDLVVLKPAAGPNNERFASTMAFKQAFLATLMETYAAAGTIRLYEDRPRHVEGFREFFEAYNGSPNNSNNNNNSFERRQTQCYPARRRPPIQGTVVPVAELATTLDPVVEVAEVQHMVRLHNAAVAAGGRPNQDGRAVAITSRHRRMAVRKTVFFTGYLLQETDTQRLLRLLHDHVPPHVVARRDLLKYHANNIMISPRACPPALLRKAGGLGRKFAWRVVALGHLDDHSVWAAKVQPADDPADVGEERVGYHTAEPVPLVVLAVWRNGRPHDASRIRAWRPLPPDEVFVMETTVGEKAMLRVEAESLAGAADENEQSLRGGKAPAKRKRFSGHGGHGGGGPYPSGPSNATVGVGRGRPPFPHHNTGTVPTQPAAFAAGSGGRGYHNVPTAPRGGFRGAGFGRGAYRGGGSLRGRGGGPGV
ncbi:hypothetical protein SPI_08698 [Niveomyces insectorum RCEF 264]|uniref:Swiss Army Knife RNA repair protein HAD domain-containing protein n=1 Tax=Niveomyces insectorum RCEF 264 TaxID=1081102 RepID=A0A167MW83_9HYPO|nr:hypothetical protein SPI_08698 [Niveomyces insectorum RCEF 264]